MPIWNEFKWMSFILSANELFSTNFQGVKSEVLAVSVEKWVLIQIGPAKFWFPWICPICSQKSEKA